MFLKGTDSGYLVAKSTQVSIYLFPFSLAKMELQSIESVLEELSVQLPLIKDSWPKETTDNILPSVISA